ncbi:MAG: hypothetical protein V7678_04795 [Brevundimonas sp.]
MLGKAVIVAVLLMSQPAEGSPECVSPAPPEKLFITAPARPAAPSCVNERTNRHTCSNRIINAYGAEIDAYDAAFDAYVDAINAYIERLNEHMVATNAYTQCEQRRVAPNSLIVG